MPIHYVHSSAGGCNLSSGFLNTWKGMGNCSHGFFCKGMHGGDSNSVMVFTWLSGIGNILSTWTWTGRSMDYIDRSNRRQWCQKPSVNTGAKQGPTSVPYSESLKTSFMWRLLLLQQHKATSFQVATLHHSHCSLCLRNFFLKKCNYICMKKSIGVMH